MVPIKNLLSRYILSLVIISRSGSSWWGSRDWLLILLFICGCSFSEQARRQALSKRQFYVDAATGNDAHTGRSPAQAWKTLAKVNSQIFEPGDILLFKAGTEATGQLKIQGAGAKDRLITIDRYGKGPKPRISAKGLH